VHARVTPDWGFDAAAISRFASTLDGLFRDLLADARFEDIVARYLREGRHENPDRVPEWFTAAYFHLAGELAGEVRDAGLELEALLAIEGPAAFLPDLDDRLDDPDRRATLLRTLERIESEPDLLGAGPRLLAIGRRR